MSAPRSLGRRNLLEEFEPEPTLHGTILLHRLCGTRIVAPSRTLADLVEAAYSHDCPGAPDA